MAWTHGYPKGVTSQKDKYAWQSWYTLYQLGYNKNACAGILGNIQEESAGTMSGDIDQIGGPAYGAIQFDGSGYPLVGAPTWNGRTYVKRLFKASGIKGSYKELEPQMKLVNWSMTHGQWIGKVAPTSVSGFKKASSPEQAATAFQMNFERPGAPSSNRPGYARKWYNRFKNYPIKNNGGGGNTGDGGSGGGGGGGDDKPTNVLQKDPVKVFKAVMEQMFTNIYFQNNNYLYKNFFIKITKQMNNMYKIKPTFDFSKMSIKDINDLFGLWHPESSGGGGGGNTGSGGSGGGGDKKGYYWPYKQETIILTSPFGPRNDSHGFHQGIDIVGNNKWGDPICAIHSGTVLVAGDAGVANGGLPGWEEAGSMIVIKNDDKEGKYVTYEEYAPGTNQVKKGDKVKGGQIIAHTGVSGNSTGVHLHLGISDPPNPPTAYNVIPPAISPHWHNPAPYIGIANKAGSYRRPKKINKP